MADVLFQQVMALRTLVHSENLRLIHFSTVADPLARLAV